MAQPPVRSQPGIPLWVWIVALVVVIAALWWVFAGGRAEPVAAAADRTGALAPQTETAPAPAPVPVHLPPAPRIVHADLVPGIVVEKPFRPQVA